MELNHMSPSPPTSPTPSSYEDDECWPEVSYLAIDSVTLLICLCGLVGNGAVFWLLGFRIRRNPITGHVLKLAAINFAFLSVMSTSSILYMVENVSCSTVVNFNPTYLSWALLALYSMGLYSLTAISIERCMSILCPLKYRCHCPQYVLHMVYILLFALSHAFPVAITFLCPGHKHCQIALMSMYTLNLFIFAPSMVISSTILLIQVQCGSQQHQPKRLYIAIFLTVLLFLLFALPLSICNFLQQFHYTTLSSQVVFLLACINSSLNPFIYFLVGSCQRQCSLVSPRKALQRVLAERKGSRARRNNIKMDEQAPAL